MRAGIAGALVETKSGNRACHVCLELHAEIDVGGVVFCNGRGRCRRRKQVLLVLGYDVERHLGRVGSALPVGDRVRKARSAGVAVRRREGDGIRRGVEGDGAVHRVSDTGNDHRIAIGITVIGKECARLYGERGVEWRRVPGIVERYRAEVPRCLLVEDIHPVVRRAVGGRREEAGRTIGKDTVSATSRTGRRRQRAVRVAGREEVRRHPVEGLGMIAGDVGSPGNRDRLGESHRLPATGALVGEGSGRKQFPPLVHSEPVCVPVSWALL